MKLRTETTMKINGMYVKGHLEAKDNFSDKDKVVFYVPDADITKYSGYTMKSIREQISELEELLKLMEVFDVSVKIDG